MEMTGVNPFEILPNEVLFIVVSYCARVSLPALCFVTATCSRMRPFRHEPRISSLSDRNLWHLFESEAVVRAQFFRLYQLLKS